MPYVYNPFINNLDYYQSGGGSGGITTINGDSGSVTGSTVSLLGANAGSTVSFTAASATEMDFLVTDISSNTIMGLGAGNNALSGLNNTGFGRAVLQNITSASSCTVLGEDAGLGITSGDQNTIVGAGSGVTIADGTRNTILGANSGTSFNGSYNVLLGYSAGVNLSLTNSSNVLISNLGSGSDNNVVRIGTQGTGNGQQDRSYIVGPIYTANGLSSAPAYSFAAFTDCGMFSDGTNTYLSGAGFATVSAGFNVTLSGGITSITQGVVCSSVNAKNADFTCVYGDYFYPIDSSGGAITATLMNSPITGQKLVFKDDTNSAGTHAITISGVTSGKNIDNASTATISINGGSLTLIYNGTQWNII